MSETNTAIVVVILLLGLKHFVVDFPLQRPYQWMNKGTYGHPGGILHSSLHAVATACVLLPYASIVVSVICAVVDLVVHYHIDWAKMNVNKKFGWGANTHEQFWWLLGADQFAHQLTYVWMIWFIFC